MFGPAARTSSCCFTRPFSSDDTYLCMSQLCRWMVWGLGSLVSGPYIPPRLLSSLLCSRWREYSGSPLPDLRPSEARATPPAKVGLTSSSPTILLPTSSSPRSATRSHSSAKDGLISSSPSARRLGTSSRSSSLLSSLALCYWSSSASVFDPALKRLNSTIRTNEVYYQDPRVSHQPYKP
jgi:hypothetical protein